MNWLEASVRWYAAIAAITWAFAPFVHWLCRALDDRGVAVSRPIALLATIYPAWILSSIRVARFESGMVAGTVIIAGAVGWALMARTGVLDRRWLRGLLLVELASLSLFAAYIWLRGYTPQILGTEKPMDIALLASSARAVSMPPPDPWFAGEPINYYYLGYLLHGTVGRLAGVPPEFAFNLALATAFTMSAVAAFGVAWNAVRPWLGPRAAVVSGTLAAFGLTIAGNLYAPWRLLQDARVTIDAFWWDSSVGVGWRSSRIVCDGPRTGNLCEAPATETINEFPFFSFLLGDLHPHVMALPFTLVSIALAWNLACRRKEGNDARRGVWPIRVILSGAIVGSLYALNAWDFPTFLILTALGVVAGFGGSLLGALRLVAILGLSAIVAWLPFLAAYDPPTVSSLRGLPAWFEELPVLPSLVSAVAVHVGERTSALEYLTMFGVPYAFGVVTVATSAAAASESSIGGNLRTLAIAAGSTIVPGVLLAAPIVPLCGIPVTLAVALLVQSRTPSPRTFALAAYSFSWLISIVVEFVYIRDAFDDRMNTLFKFYYQTWTLYALATGVGIAYLWATFPSRSWQRAMLATATAAAVFAGLMYPSVASYQWTENFSNWQGLDGLAYGAEAEPDDIAAIRWLGSHATSDDIVLEAAGCAYGPRSFTLPFSRASAFTGIPTVIGWGDNHQRQWRAGQQTLLEEIGRRENDVAAMFEDPQAPQFDQYAVTWLFVGSYEFGDWKSECPIAGPYAGVSSPEYPGPGWEEAFRSGGTRIYRRITA